MQRSLVMTAPQWRANYFSSVYLLTCLSCWFPGTSDRPEGTSQGTGMEGQHLYSQVKQINITIHTVHQTYHQTSGANICMIFVMSQNKWCFAHKTKHCLLCSLYSGDYDNEKKDRKTETGRNIENFLKCCWIVHLVYVLLHFMDSL